MSEPERTTALDGQGYFEERTAGVRDNALARRRREELRDHLEADARQIACVSSQHAQHWPVREAFHE